jgi:hypothetical protein
VLSRIAAILGMDQVEKERDELRAALSRLQADLDANIAAFDQERAERIKAQGEATALAAMVERLQAGGGEVVATLHDDGYWTPAKSEAGRALNERLMRAGTRVEVCLPHPAAPAKVLVPLPPEKVREVCSGIYLSDHPQGSSSYDQALADALSEALATHNGLTLGDGGEKQG